MYYPSIQLLFVPLFHHSGHKGYCWLHVETASGRSLDTEVFGIIIDFVWDFGSKWDCESALPPACVPLCNVLTSLSFSFLIWTELLFIIWTEKIDWIWEMARDNISRNCWRIGWGRGRRQGWLLGFYLKQLGGNSFIEEEVRESCVCGGERDQFWTWGFEMLAIHISGNVGLEF